MTDLLTGLHAALRDAGLNPYFAEATPEAPVDQVILSISEDEDLFVLLSELPGMDPPVFQVYVPFPVDVPEERAADVARVVCDTNRRLPVHGFEYAPDRDQPLGFRMVVPLAGESWNLHRVDQAVGLALNLVARMSPIVRDVATGDLDLADAASELDRA